MGLDRDYRKFRDADHAALWERAAEFMEWLGYERPRLGGTKPWRFSESEKKFVAGGQSLVVDPRRRKWYAHKGGQGGTSLVSLLKYELGVAWSEAYRLAREFLGSYSQDTESSKRPEHGSSSAVDDRSAEAAAIWRDGLRVAGTPAEVYLRNERQIPNDHWPAKLVRYCLNAFPGSRKAQPAVVFPLTDAAGKVRAVQRVVLNDDGTPALDAEGKRIKRSLGPMSGAPWRLPGTDDALILAEGPETAATVWAVTDNETWALCGSVGKADLSGIPLTRPIIISQDADPPNSPSAQSLKKAIRRWRREGRTVLTVRPPGNDKSDWNDVIRAHGADAVSEAFKNCWKTTPLPKRLPLIKAEIALQDAVETSIANLLKEPLMSGFGQADPPPFDVIKVDTGLGKTELAIRNVVKFAASGKRIVYVVPAHKLAKELVDRIKAVITEVGVDVQVAVWRGRDQVAPDGQLMCREPGLITDARAAGLRDVTKQICEDICPHKVDCAYLEQRKQPGQIWIAATPLIFTEKPKSMGVFDVMVIDEAFTKGQVREFVITPEDLAEVPVLPASRENDWREAKPMRDALIKLLAGRPPGYIQRQELLDAGIMAEACDAARKAEWRAKIEVDIAGLRIQDVRKRLQEAAKNSRITHLATLWRELEAFLRSDWEASGRIWFGPRYSSNAEKYDALTVMVPAEIRKGWWVPALHLDATTRIDLIKPFVPQAKLVTDIAVEVPSSVTAEQVIGKTFGMNDLNSNVENLRRVWLYACRQVQKGGGEGLVVMQKNAEETIRRLAEAGEPGWVLPRGVHLAHHNAIAGRDEWRHVRTLIVIGRTQPSPQHVERAAGALSGQAPVTIQGWYDHEQVTLIARDGSMVTVDVDCHPDELAEEVRASICEDELLQIIGRGRAVRRTAGRPLDIIILGNVALPLQLDALATWEPLGPDEEMLAAGAWIENGAFAVKAHPWIATNEAALKKQRQRGKSGTFSYKDIIRKMSPTSARRLVALTFQAQGQGQRPSKAIIDTAVHPEPLAYIESLAGPLARFEVHNVTGPDPMTATPTPPIRPPLPTAERGKFVPGPQGGVDFVIYNPDTLFLFTQPVPMPDLRRRKMSM